MMQKPEPKPDDPEQSKRFIDMALEVQVDEGPQAFEKAFKRVVSAQPEKPEKPDKP
jgi:hypothetical protein